MANVVKIAKSEQEHEPNAPLYRLIPNFMTLTALAAGLTAVVHAMAGEWDKAIVSVLIAFILDGLDGAMARLMNATSEFGAHLDTLSDFLSFGIAPGFILYSWVLGATGKWGWAVLIIYTAATALRLARFNAEQKVMPAWRAGFFSGAPSPAGAGLALLPVILSLQYPDFFAHVDYLATVVSLWTIAVGGLMISRVPTFSIKMIRVPARLAVPALAGALLLAIACFILPWPTLLAVGGLYLCSLPVSVWRFYTLSQRE